MGTKAAQTKSHTRKNLINIARQRPSANAYTETEWMTFEKATAALDDLRAAGSEEPTELDAVLSFLVERRART